MMGMIEAMALDLFERIKHGDDEHQAWLRAELLEWSQTAAEPFIQARIDEAVKAAMATAGWLPISDAPRDGSAFQAIIPGNGTDNILCWSGGLLNSDGDECGTWVFASDQEPPDDWTDGFCWEVNEDRVQSTQPTFWKAIRARGDG